MLCNIRHSKSTKTRRGWYSIYLYGAVIESADPPELWQTRYTRRASYSVNVGYTCLPILRRGCGLTVCSNRTVLANPATDESVNL